MGARHFIVSLRISSSVGTPKAPQSPNSRCLGDGFEPATTSDGGAKFASAIFGVSNNLTPHFFTGLVESLRICFNFLTENETFKAPISLLNFLDFSGWQRIAFATFDIVFAHFRRVIELNTKELGEGRVVVWDSFGSVVGKDLFTVQTVTQWLAVCWIVFNVGANSLIHPSGSCCLN